jgi:hypothetical protein
MEVSGRGMTIADYVVGSILIVIMRFLYRLSGDFRARFDHGTMGSSEPGFSTLLHHPVVNGTEPHQSDNNEIDRDDKVQKNRGMTRMRTPAIRATSGE